jgi:endoglycosylceramidase
MMFVALWAGALAPVAAASPAAPLGHSGRWITDADGRVVILHGANMVFKRPPYDPASGGFGEDDAAFLERHGFNTVRLGLIYKAVEPSAGVYDDAYIDSVADTERTLAAHGVFSLLDFHQDLYNERFQGEGWPDWAVQDDGLPAEPQFGFPGNYLGMPALNRAFDHWWANDPAGDGLGLQDHYAAALHHVAERFAGASHTVGYDLLNEPWPGSVYPTCTNPAGCPLFDTRELTAFSRRAGDAIHSADPSKLTWYEPLSIFNFGAQTAAQGPTGSQTGFSFHNYCLPGAFGMPTGDQPCDALENLVFDNADSHSGTTGDALLLTEFGATDDLAAIRRIIDDADSHMIGWQYWHYCGCDDPTTQGATSQAIVNDASRPPAGDNVRAEKLDLLSRPYPQAVAGTPESYVYDEQAKTFSLAYSTTGPGGQSFVRGTPAPGSPQTEVFLPRDDYADGYTVEVHGGAVSSAPGAEVLRVAACPGAEAVSLRVTPGAGANSAGCSRSSRRVLGSQSSRRAPAGPGRRRPAG